MKFNKKISEPKKTVNLAGGEAYVESPKLELASMLLTSFVKDQFYRDADEQIKRLREIFASLPDKKFAAQAAIYARCEYGMRSITHVMAAEIAQAVKGADWSKSFFEKIVRRPDDMSEIIAYWLSQGYAGHPPNALKKGFAKVLEGMDEYGLAKYKGSKNAVSLVDIVNLVHPRSTPALTKLMKGQLKPADTWETKLTQAGQKAESDEEKEELKAEAWKEMLETGKIGYFALLRNLRNIAEQAPDLIPRACELLVDRERIKKSLVLPFRYMTAMEAIQPLRNNVLFTALSNAAEIALDNVPELPGKTLVAVDVSGSMNGMPISQATLFAAAIFKRNGADVMTFSDTAKYIEGMNTKDTLGTVQKFIIDHCVPGGTDFNTIFNKADRSYDRIVILSDMQAWVGFHTPAASFKSYKERTKSNPRIFSFDLTGNGTMQFPENNVYALAGFSDKTMDVMNLLEKDRNALIHEIEKIEL